MNFCTKFDHHYLDRGLALYESLQRWAPGSRLHVLALSHQCAHFLMALDLPHVRVLRTEDLCRIEPRLTAAKADRNAAAYVFTQTPFLVLAALQDLSEGQHLVYIDADTCFFSSPANVVDTAREYDVCLTRHNFAAHSQPAELYGEFNTGWVGFTRTPAAMRCAGWWAERCLEWCHDRPEGGKFADQKYLEAFPHMNVGVQTLSSPGVNCAPWNVSGRCFRNRNGQIYVDEKKLVHFHFSLLQKVTPFCVAPRFSQQLVLKTRGLRRHVYSPYCRDLRAVATRFRIPREFLHVRARSARDMHAGFHSRDARPAWWRIAWRVAKGEYVIG
mgnify:CR=1 FL=1|jgi:hypothetical protein